MWLPWSTPICKEIGIGSDTSLSSSDKSLGNPVSELMSNDGFVAGSLPVWHLAIAHQKLARLPPG